MGILEFQYTYHVPITTVLTQSWNCFKKLSVAGGFHHEFNRTRVEKMCKFLYLCCHILNVGQEEVA